MDAKHVVSLELAKQLKEVEYPQEGEFWWVPPCDVASETILNNCNWNLEYENIGLSNGRGIVAPLTTELLERFMVKSNIVWKIFHSPMGNCQSKCIYIYERWINIAQAISKWLEDGENDK